MIICRQSSQLAGLARLELGGLARGLVEVFPIIIKILSSQPTIMELLLIFSTISEEFKISIEQNVSKSITRGSFNII